MSTGPGPDLDSGTGPDPDPDPDPRESFLLSYEYVADIVVRRGPHREAHLARINAEREAGRLLIAGAVGEPPHGAALGFTDVSRGNLERWVATDPYVTAGLVTSYSIEPWKLV